MNNKNNNRTNKTNKENKKGTENTKATAPNGLPPKVDVGEVDFRGILTKMTTDSPRILVRKFSSITAQITFFLKEGNAVDVFPLSVKRDCNDLIGEGAIWLLGPLK